LFLLLGGDEAPLSWPDNTLNPKVSKYKAMSKKHNLFWAILAGSAVQDVGQETAGVAEPQNLHIK
jgi:hypothetical protein